MKHQVTIWALGLLTKREVKGVNSRIKEFDLEGSVCDWTFLPDELIVRGLPGLRREAEQESTQRRRRPCFSREHDQQSIRNLRRFIGAVSSGRNMKDLIHVAVGGGGCLLRTVAVLTRA